ncbi:2-hydroxyacid dehydrogenase [Brevibacillus laterosporus]|uniref:Glyoxylate/hydroxypyruvate reductase B n=1 Tax=Brevibacillus laterosporus TaxID=1465 RepID=A0AAP8U5A5_BRELA|nr:D-glycerate dehydrogenase [Brevibacillus laterosporus]AYB41114.1 D-glycerate dehydrogenase [Brevibacillus laterosporus]MCG7319481.1 D-glycerate dehydrogenase [Brevibacillus laterosporus]NKQ20919.1 D-glycerate dehydrogenase [Brevibacillus laterosporus]PPB02227.1 D-glycerate dehydrogenase [Brevibacillus laterosporus]WNX30718.1 D-glycerate dehydrogenase [Brevibacillus laterosporus]
MTTKPFVYVTRKVAKEAMNLLATIATVEVWDQEYPVPRDILLEKAKRSDGLYVMLSDRIDRELIDAAPHLKVVSTLAVGYDNIDVEACKKRGIVVTNTPDVLTDATADLAFGLLMAAGRRFVEANRVLMNGEWKTWSPYFMAGQRIHGATIGIIGMGRIGEAVAKRASGFDMRILYHNRSRKVEAEETYGATYCSLPDLLCESDYVVLLTPLTEETKGLMGAEQFAMMKSTAVFINASRGATVDEVALYQALKQETIWAAGLDVFQQEPIPTDHPLLSLPNVVALPHIGSATYETRDRMAMLVSQNLVAVLSGDEAVTPV